MPERSVRQRPAVLGKRRGDAVAPNLDDYERVRAVFTWAHARALLDGLPEGRGLNIAHEAIDRHAAGPLRDHVAIRWLGKRGEVRDYTYAALRELTDRFASALDALGVRRGDRIFALAGRIPELYVTALGTLKHGSVFCPLFSAFGPEPIRARMTIGQARVLVTTEALYQRKVAPMRGELSDLAHVILAGDGAAPTNVAGTHDFHALLGAAADRYVIPPTAPGDMALLHFTSGTTGKPKGAVHVHEAVVAHHVTGRYALDLHPDDVFWCTADPGWVTGTSYGIIAPLTNGVTSLVDEAEFDAERWYRTLQDQRVTVWCTAPTAIRMLMKAGTGLARKFDTSALRFLASVGEPLNPEAVLWGQEAFGRPFHDNWWQTETGGIMIANFASMDVRPGSMGRPLPGVEAAIVRRTGDDAVEVLVDPDVEGELALRPGWPSMFREYLGEPARYRKCFAGGWYLTGDLARRDADGYFWFVGRADDVIKTSGHLIGPFEVESVLMEHRAVAEAGVIGKPDPVALEVVKAFVALKSGWTATPELRRELLAHARRRLGAVVAPKEIDVVASIPKTRSGKIMRRLLKARELGLPEGDLWTLEGSEPHD
jgi:acetyl-CoA synthetase